MAVCDEVGVGVAVFDCVPVAVIVTLPLMVGVMVTVAVRVAVGITPMQTSSTNHPCQPLLYWSMVSK